MTKDLKKNLAQYINSLIRNAIEEDDLFKTVKQYLLAKVPELEFDDLLKLFAKLDSKKVTTNNQLTGLLRPGTQSLSPLLEAFNNIKDEENEDTYEKVFKESSSEDLRKLDKADKALNVIEKIYDAIEKKQREENEDKSSME